MSKSNANTAPSLISLKELAIGILRGEIIRSINIYIKAIESLLDENQKDREYMTDIFHAHFAFQQNIENTFTNWGRRNESKDR